jgi:hypothetical protein
VLSLVPAADVLVIQDREFLLDVLVENFQRRPSQIGVWGPRGGGRGPGGGVLHHLACRASFPDMSWLFTSKGFCLFCEREWQSSREIRPLHFC